jgi:hypothetical protein
MTRDMRLSNLIPQPVRGYLKNVRRDVELTATLRPLRDKGRMTDAEVAAFHKAWGNEGFAADKDYLARLLTMLESGPVLECGTGGTTLLANVMGQRNGFDTYCLEQNPEWARPVNRSLRHTSTVRVLDAPLRDFGGYHWYDAQEVLPMHFALVICDGPYIDAALGEPSYSAWRYGVLPWLHSTGRTFDALLLDDVNDPRAPATLNRWKSEFGVNVEGFVSADGECAIITP